MGKFGCICGVATDYATYAKRDKFVVFDMRWFRSISDILTEAANSPISSEAFEEVVADLTHLDRSPGIVVYQCPNCSRLLVVTNGYIRMSFLPEEFESAQRATRLMSLFGEPPKK